MGAVMAEYAYNELGYRTVYVITDDFIDYTKSLSEYFIVAFEEIGGEVFFEDTYTQGQADASAQVARIKDLPEQPDFVYVSSYMPDLALIIRTLRESGIDVPTITGGEAHACAGTCPGREARTLETTEGEERAASTASRLGHWPVQLHLLSPIAPYFKEADVLLVADCVAYALAGFHDRFLAGKSIAIACPKLDSNKDAYIEKLRLMIDEAKINTLTVIKMEVPCCSGIVRLAQEAASRASRKVPIKSITVSIRGEIIDEKCKGEGDLRREVSMNIKRLMDLGAYRGLRHRRGLPVRGQRTSTNARTRKGPRRAVMGKRKK